MPGAQPAPRRPRPGSPWHRRRSRRARHRRGPSLGGSSTAPYYPPMEARSAPAGRSPVLDVDAAILHVVPAPDAGRLTLATAEARRTVAERHRRGFLTVGARRARIIEGPPDGRPFGARLHEVLGDLEEGGLIVLGSGAVPLASARDRRE